MQNTLKAILIVILFSGCFSKENNKPKNQAYYFDLKGYFSKLALALNKSNPTVNKSVAKNKETETKKLKIKNWKEELALFVEADINKPAWKESYVKDSTANKVSYTSKDLDLKTQKIEVSFDANKIPIIIRIETKVDNLLYHTEQTLTFYADSAYSINKVQKVILFEENNYLIKGRFK